MMNCLQFQAPKSQPNKPNHIARESNHHQFKTKFSSFLYTQQQFQRKEIENLERTSSAHTHRYAHTYAAHLPL